MNIQLIPVLASEFDTLFTVVKQGIYPYVEKLFGWDDDFQKQRLLEEYEPSWFYWLYIDNISIGMLCYKPYANSLHIHLLIIFPEFQNRGFGYLVMSHIHESAKTANRKSITLSSFVLNKDAIRFYKKLGYQLVECENDFQSFKIEIT
ncbi:GNAT family N-acetyltransferase [Psychrobacter sp. B38]|uniref:GNAT family N-acetyltransferase n=1 Tax=Psychrobacter sp. B38 TaxID=3143538 RepID=UPI0032102B61